MNLCLAMFYSQGQARNTRGLALLMLLAVLPLLSLATRNAIAAEPNLESTPINTAQYTIDSATSYIHVYTGTTGLLKSVSHRHLIAISNIQGDISWNKDDGLNSANAQANLLIRPEQFIVDGNAERRTAVDKRYRKAAANWVKSGTRKNMLGKRFFNIEFYPTITADIKLKSLNGEQGLFEVTLNIIGHTKQLSIPATLAVSDNTINVSGDFKLSHTDLGLKRYRAAGGAASVAESLRFIINISASTIDPSDIIESSEKNSTNKH